MLDEAMYARRRKEKGKREIPARICVYLAFSSRLSYFLPVSSIKGSGLVGFREQPLVVKPTRPPSFG